MSNLYTLFFNYFSYCMSFCRVLQTQKHGGDFGVLSAQNWKCGDTLCYYNKLTLLELTLVWMPLQKLQVSTCWWILPANIWCT